MLLTELTETAAQKRLKPVSEINELPTTFAPQAENPPNKTKTVPDKPGPFNMTQREALRYIVN
jgi:hypothetical protein